MPEYEITPPYRLYGSDPLSGLLNLQKAGGLAYRKAQQEEFNRAKSTVASLIGSYNTANSQTLQGEIVNTMKGYYSSLPIPLQKAVDPYIAHGPTSKMAEKRRQFTQQFKSPQRPGLNEAPGEAAEWENTQNMVNYAFSSSDYNRAMRIFMGGKEMAGDKTTFLPLPDGGAAVRNEEGMITYLTRADLNLKELEEKYGFTAKDILLNPQGIPTGDKSILQINGRKITNEIFFNPFAEKGKEYTERRVSVSEMPKSRHEITHPAKLISLLMEWKQKSPDDDFIAEQKMRALKEPRAVEEEFNQLFPSYSFRIIKRKEGFWKGIFNILPIVSADESLGIIPIRGKLTQMVDNAGKVHNIFYDPTIDLVSNSIGTTLGSWEMALANFNSRLER